MVKIYFPDNIDEILSKYLKTEHKRIKDQYKKIYKNNIEEISKIVEDRFKNDIYNHDSHCKALTNILTPFLRQNFESYELLFIEPLLYLRNIGEISEDTPIWDFILVEIIGNNLNRIILGEIKTQKARSVMDKVTEAVNKYSNKDLLDKLFDYIQKLMEKKKINFNKDNVKIEKLLVVQSSYYENYEKSVVDRQLDLNIWEIDPDILRYKYTIKIHRWDKLLEKDNIYSENDEEYLKLLSSLRNNTFKDEEFISFTYASDLNLVLDFLYKSYKNLYGLSYSDSNLIDLIVQAGGGNFYDDERVIPDLVKKVKELFKQYRAFKKEGDKVLFKQRIRIRRRIINIRLRREIEKKVGENFLKQAIDELDPKKSPKTHKLDKWLFPTD